jgi:hypothetical protein
MIRAATGVWLKTELQEFCREHGTHPPAGTAEIAGTLKLLLPRFVFTTTMLPIYKEASMLRRSLFLSVLLLAGAACSSGSSSPAGAVVPAVPSVTYEREGAMEMNIDLGGTNLPVVIRESGILEAHFEPRSDGARVSAEYRSWNASISNPMAGDQSADQTQIRGATVFDLDARGRVSVASLPEVTGTAQELFDGTQLAHDFFPRLPGRLPEPGESWTDTIAYESDSAGGRSQVESAIDYTAVGDTVLDGQRLLHIRAESQDRIEVRGTSGGQAFSQSLEGTSQHNYLWDGQAGALHTSRIEGVFAGSMTVDAVGMQFSVRGSGRTLMRRIGGR